MSKESLPFIVIFTLLASTAYLFATSVSSSANVQRKQIEEPKAPVLVETNSIGCEKYEFKESTFWKCPKELSIDSIETTEHYRVGNIPKSRIITEPVIED